jgi:hypothetical protein
MEGKAGCDNGFDENDELLSHFLAFSVFESNGEWQAKHNVTKPPTSTATS